MKKIFIVSTILVTTILLPLLTGCVQLDAPKVQYIDYRINRVNTEGVEVNFYFDVTNKNPVSLDVANYSYDVYTNNKKVITQTGHGFSLAANATQRITLPVFVRYEGVFGAALSLIESIARGEKEMDYRVDGSISAGAMGLTATAPLKASGKIKIPANIQIR
ncbi:MAG: LEA type 2 family protein [Candidatus Margulisiibacteriota bacterium]|nr:LEA type 2 family protein [Candidatus Margulisiibacteriota bacterium]